MVTLENLSRRMRTYNLVHPAHQKPMKFLREKVDHRGDKVFSRHTKPIFDSLTLTAAKTPGATAKGLPDTILECPEIKAAIKRGELRSIVQKENSK